MKHLSLAIIVVLIAGCSGMGGRGHMSGGGMSGGASGAQSAYGTVGNPNVNAGFDPNNPYHGG